MFLIFKLLKYAFVENIGHRFALLKELVTNVPHGAPLEGHPPRAAGPEQHRDLLVGGGVKDDAAGQAVEDLCRQGGLERDGRRDIWNGLHCHPGVPEQCPRQLRPPQCPGRLSRL